MGDDREIADVPHRVGHGQASVMADGAALRGKRGIIARLAALPRRPGHPASRAPQRGHSGAPNGRTPLRTAGEADVHSASSARGVTAKKRVELPRRTSSIPVWPGLTPARSTYDRTRVVYSTTCHYCTISVVAGTLKTKKN